MTSTCINAFNLFINKLCIKFCLSRSRWEGEIDLLITHIIVKYIIVYFVIGYLIEKEHVGAFISVSLLFVILLKSLSDFDHMNRKHGYDFLLFTNKK